jgi:hypothetical protein
MAPSGSSLQGTNMSSNECRATVRNHARSTANRLRSASGLAALTNQRRRSPCAARNWPRGSRLFPLQWFPVTFPAIVAAQAPEGQSGAVQNNTGDHPNRRAPPPLAEPHYYQPCPANVVMANGRHECLG